MKELNREMTLAEIFKVLNNHNVKDIDSKDLWYDWCCKTSALHNRGITLLRKLKSIKNSKKFDKENTYVWFKNNLFHYGLSRHGWLYDDFRIADKETDDVIYIIIPKNVEYEEAEVWGRENDFESPIVKGTWNDVKAFFMA